MSLWSTTFNQSVDDLIVLFRNLTGRENPTLREKQVMDRAVNEALQEISMFRYGRRVRFLEVAHQIPITEGTHTYSIVGTTETSDTPELVSIINGTVTLEDENTVLSQISLEEWEQLITPDDNTLNHEPYYYALGSDSSNGADYMEIRLYPIPDDSYTLKFRGTKVISDEGISEIPSVLQGALMDLATSTAMRRIGFGNPGGYQQMAERALDNYSKVTDSDGPIHIPRGARVYRTGGIQSRTP